MAGASIFINAPYDKDFEPLFLAYLVGVLGFRLMPRAALEIGGSANRIDRVVEMIKRSRLSIHDLSRVELSAGPPHLPRFNMPFELGMAYFYSRSEAAHQCFIFDGDHRQFEKSLSDLKGVDIYAHGSEVRRLFSQLCSALNAQDLLPTVHDMTAVYILVLDRLPSIMADAGSDSIFHARVFERVVFAANKFWAARQVKSRSSQP